MRNYTFSQKKVNTKNKKEKKNATNKCFFKIWQKVNVHNSLPCLRDGRGAGWGRRMGSSSPPCMVLSYPILAPPCMMRKTFSPHSRLTP